MRLLPLLLFIAVPLAELAILIKLGEVIGIWSTIALVIGTAVLGVALLKRQGLAALERARSSMDAGEFPVESVVDGACLLIAGAFLLTPGLLTDTVGFSLLVPAFRLALARWIFAKFKTSESMQFHTSGMGQNSPGTGPQHPGGYEAVIEGDFKDLDDEPSVDGPSEEKSSDERPSSSNPSDPKSSPWRK